MRQVICLLRKLMDFILHINTSVWTWIEMFGECHVFKEGMSICRLPIFTNSHRSSSGFTDRAVFSGYFMKLKRHPIYMLLFNSMALLNLGRAASTLVRICLLPLSQHIMKWWTNIKKSTSYVDSVQGGGSLLLIPGGTSDAEIERVDDWNRGEYCLFCKCTV